MIYEPTQCTASTVDGGEVRGGRCRCGQEVPYFFTHLIVRICGQNPTCDTHENNCLREWPFDICGGGAEDYP